MHHRSDASPLIVAGMHRSGTSYVASLLRRSGVDMGARLMPAARGNERGHFENLDFVEFHERWLRLSGHDEAGWAVPHAPALTDEGWSEALELLSSNRASGPWGWKDPRTTLFLDFWANVAPNTRYVLLYREPSEVVDSLFRRRDAAIVASPELAARAWLCHNGIVLRFARANRSRCILANVSVAARDPQRFLHLVASKFELPLNQNISSPFEANLMGTVEQGTLKFSLLRYLMPETESLFLELESEADLAAGAHRDAPMTAKRARDIFFSQWAATHGEPSFAPQNIDETYGPIREKARDQIILTTGVVSSVSKVRKELEQYKAALLELSEASDVRGEEQFE